MKILFDENMPHRLRRLMQPAHEVFTVQYLGWSGIQNGQLLRLMVENGFEAFITIDKKMERQQNTTNLPLIFLVLDSFSNDPKILEPFIQNALQFLSQNPENGVYEIGTQS